MPNLQQRVSSLADRQPGLWLVRGDDRVVALAPLPLRPRPIAYLRVRRPDDMVLLDVVLVGITVKDLPAGRVLQRSDATATLVVHFPPQSVAEQVIPDASLTDQPSPLTAGSLPVRARHSGRSRLALSMPSDVQAIDATADAILAAMASWPLRRVPLQLTGPVLLDVSGRIDALADVLTELLPVDRTVHARGILDRVVQRAVWSVVPGDLSAAAVVTAGESLAAEMASVTTTLDFDPDESSALALQAELTFAARLVEREAARFGVDATLGFLPGLTALLTPVEPSSHVTAIELPYRLTQSPGDAAATFSHAQLPVTRNNRTELWHTRLGTRHEGQVVDATEEPTTLAAVWSPDYGALDGQPDGAEPGFQTSLTAAERDQIVRLTADQSGYTAARPPRRYAPVPSRVQRLMLTALGGWLDLEGVWDGPRPAAGPHGLPVDLVSWKHHTALGRDWFVETVHIGRMLPFAHRAVTVFLTERRFQDAPEGAGRVAVLRQKVFVEIRQPLRTYPEDTQPFAGRDFPFRTVEILTKRTPGLLMTGLPAGETTSSFWPRVTGPAGPLDFRFEVRTTDVGGKVSRFDVPMRFVSDAAIAEPAIAAYNGPDQTRVGRTTAPLHGQPLQLAPAADRVTANGAPDPGDVVYPAAELRFGASAPTKAPPPDGSLPRFHPRVRTTKVMSTALSQLTGNDEPAEMAFATVYQTNGFDPATNKTELLLVSAGPATLTADFSTRSSSDKAGGIVTPNFGVTGTSRAFGLVGGDTNLLAGGTFDPKSFFPSAKIFGGIDLKDLLVMAAIGVAGDVVPAPILTTTRTAEKIETTFALQVSKMNTLPVLRINERGDSTLDIKAVTAAYFVVADPVARDADGRATSTIGSGPGATGGNPPGLKESEASVEAKLTWFKLNFFSCIIVSFDSFTFSASVAKGIDADPKIAETDGVVFGGPLSFVDDLRKTLGGSKKKKAGSGSGSGDGDSGGGGGIPGFEVTPIFKPELTGLTVGVKLGITKIPIGIFVMKNLMVSTSVKLPFDGEPLSLQFGFAERANPFQLVVSLLGGGGFVVLGLDTEHDVKEIEAALEFGAFAELDIGVASGAVYVKAGIYLYWNKPEKQTTLKGYVEVGGEVQVLGILSVSILMHLSLGYYKVGAVSEVRGQATLVVEIEFLFFSASVNLTVERRFGGAAADPTFADLIPTSTLWDEYADAFA